MSVTELTSLATARPPLQQGLPLAQRDMQKVEQGVLPFCPVLLPARVLCMPGAGAHYPGLPTCRQPQGGKKAMSAGVTPLIRGVMVELLLKHLKPFPSHSVMTI